MAALYRNEGEYWLLSGSSYSLVLMNCWEKDFKANKSPNLNSSAAASAGKMWGCCQEPHVALVQDAVWREDRKLEVVKGGTVGNEFM